MRMTIILGLILAGNAFAADVATTEWTHVAASRLSTGPVLLRYSTGHDGKVVAQIDGIDLRKAKGIELAIRSEFPTQLRLYLVGGPPSGAGRTPDREGSVPEAGNPSDHTTKANVQPALFRYLVFSKTMLERKLVLPLASFDTDPLATNYVAPAGGSLVIKDCPGFLRNKLVNRLAVGPLKLLDQTPPTPADEIPPGPEADRDPVFRRILGGWIGKAAGGEAGMPTEGKLSRDASVVEIVQKGLPASTWGFGPDDDTSFEVMHLIVARERGQSLGAQDLVRSWLRTFSQEYLWKAERYALSAMASGVFPPQTGEGPFGETLCARIRSDLWGYLCPIEPAKAIDLVGRDAPISNCGEGIRAAEFTATAVSLAFGGGTVEDLIRATLAAQPIARSAHTAVVQRCLDDFRSGRTIEQAYTRLKTETFGPIRDRDPRNAWVYALPNAGLTTLALLYGRGDFAKTVALAASLGLDADCNAATAGCILGVLLTDEGIPATFKNRLKDRIRVAVAGREHWSIRRLAAETRQATAQFTNPPKR